ncbi:hypothetical protein D3C84_694010 [compost metagenome]
MGTDRMKACKWELVCWFVSIGVGHVSYTTTTTFSPKSPKCPIQKSGFQETPPPIDLSTNPCVDVGYRSDVINATDLSESAECSGLPKSDCERAQDCVQEVLAECENMPTHSAFIVA